jgi:hypothetical protein
MRGFVTGGGRLSGVVSIDRGVMKKSGRKGDFFIARWRRTRVWQGVVMKKCGEFFSV